MKAEEIGTTLTKQVLTVLGTVGEVLLRLFFGPLVTATEPFFRKRMGVRYFRTDSLIFGGMIWLCTAFVGSYLTSRYFDESSTMSVWLKAHDYSMSIGTIFFFLFIVLGGSELWHSRNRCYSKEIWHTRSRGESLFGSESKVRDGIILAVVWLVLSYFATLVGLVFLVSRLLRESFDQLDRKRALAKYWDAMDAQIEQRFLFKSLMFDAPPAETCGLYGPLPSKFVGKYRELIAKAGTDNPIDVFEGEAGVHKREKKIEFDPSEIVIRKATPQKVAKDGQGSATMYPQDSFPELSKMAAEAQMADTDGDSQNSSAPSEKTVYSKWIVAVIAIVLVAVLIHYWNRNHNSKPKNAEFVLVSQASPSSSLRFNLTEPRQERDIDLQRIAKQKIIANIVESLAGQLTTVELFKSQSDNRILQNTNRIAGVAKSYRADLTQRNQRCEAEMQKTYNAQKDVFAAAIKRMQASGDTLGIAELNQFKSQFEAVTLAATAGRQDIISMLDSLDQQIANTPKKSGFLSW